MTPTQPSPSSTRQIRLSLPSPISARAVVIRGQAFDSAIPMVYDIFGQSVADYSGSGGTTLERENIYRGGQLLATETSLSAAPSGLATTAASGNVTLNWTAAAGATNYRVERKAAGGSFTYLAATANTNFTDNSVTSGAAYLYQVCAANADPIWGQASDLAIL